MLNEVKFLLGRNDCFLFLFYLLELFIDYRFAFGRWGFGVGFGFRVWLLSFFFFYGCFFCSLSRRTFLFIWAVIGEPAFFG